MNKLFVIKTCSDCPNWTINDAGKVVCVHRQPFRIILRSERPIPGWCPLEDYIDVPERSCKAGFPPKKPKDRETLLMEMDTL